MYNKNPLFIHTIYQFLGDHMGTQLTDLGQFILLDRYSHKVKEGFSPGDTVIAISLNSSELGQNRVLATIKNINGDNATIIVKDTEKEIEINTRYLEKPLETTSEEIQKRVAKGIAQVESEEKRQEWENNFAWLLNDWKFVPGGRILTAAGTDQKLSYYNCYVLPNPHDSRGGIMHTLTEMTEIMSRGGGVGINISSLRPKHSVVMGVNGRSSGSVSWGGLYSYVTGLVEQAGCFAGDTRISTDKGLIPIKEIVERMENNEVFYALTHQGIRKITDKFKNGRKPIVHITTKKGFAIDVTPNHPMLYLEDGKITTMKASYMAIGDNVLLSNPEKSQSYIVGEATLKPYNHSEKSPHKFKGNRIEQPETMNPDLAYLLGYSYGDGYVHKNKALKLATADSYPQIRERLIDIAKKQFGITPIIHNGAGAVKSVCLYSVELIQWLSINGMLKDYSTNIRVPEIIFRSDRESILSFIAGYFDADGSVAKKKKGIKISSVSKVMLQDVQILLAHCGIMSQISTFARANPKWLDMHELYIRGNIHKERFSNDVPTCKDTSIAVGQRDMTITYDRGVANKLAPQYRKNIWATNQKIVTANQLTKIHDRVVEYGDIDTAIEIEEILNLSEDTITSIEYKQDEETFDLTVEDNHMLSGNGVYTHNSRRGALLLMLADWHPDVLDYINAKREAGKITNANISVAISDKFMEAIKNDAMWQLKFPDTQHPSYDEYWDGDINTWESMGLPVIVYNEIPAKDIWNAIIESAWASAEPGLWFIDRVNAMSNSWYYPSGKLVSTNPCVTGDTRIQTNKGLITAQKLFDDETEFSVSVDGRFGTETFQPSSRVFYTGKKNVYEIKTKRGYRIRATDNHQFMTPNGWVELKNLEPGDNIHLMNREGGFGESGSLNDGRVLGWIVGDGHFNGDRAVLSFYHGEKEELAPIFADYVYDMIDKEQIHNRDYGIGVVKNNDARDTISSVRLSRVAKRYGLTKEKKHVVPEGVFTGNKDMQAGFLQGLFEADGGVQGSQEKGFSVRLSSSYPSLLEEVQILLGNFGIISTIYKRREAGYKKLPNYRGGYSDYYCKTQYDLVISKNNMVIFSENIGFISQKKNDRLNNLLGGYKKHPYAERFIDKIQSITHIGIESVYDLNQPTTSSFIGNNIVIHNCGEESLPGNSICNLGALNLSKFVKNDAVDWDTLKTSIHYGVRFLDNVIDANFYWNKNHEDQQSSERRVGLGIMGLAEMLIMMKIRYGSPKAAQFTENVFRFIATEAYQASVNIAAEKGAFPNFDKDFLGSGFVSQMPDHIRERISENGIRNVTLLTVAPTGSTASMLNTSTGIEPFFSWKYYRKSRLGTFEQNVPLVEKFYEENPGEELPNYFVTAMELDPVEHVAMQAAAQKWVDASISKTCNIPNSYTVEQVGEIYQQMYDLGCKGGTVYRDGSRSEQILQTETKTHTNNQELEHKPITFSSRENKLHAIVLKGKTPYGSVFITISEDPSGFPFEVFITIGKSGSDLQAQAESMGRMFSLALQSQSVENRLDMLRILTDQNRGIGGSRSYGFGPNRVSSFPDAVAKIIEEYISPKYSSDKKAINEMQSFSVLGEMKGPAYPNIQESLIHISGADICPECSNVTFTRTDGCGVCHNCGYSEC